MPRFVASMVIVSVVKVRVGRTRSGRLRSVTRRRASPWATAAVEAQRDLRDPAVARPVQGLDQVDVVGRDGLSRAMRRYWPAGLSKAATVHVVRR